MSDERISRSYKKYQVKISQLNFANCTMKNFIKLLTMAGLLIMILFSCSENLIGPDPVRGELPRELTASEEKIIKADLQFSYELFKKVASKSAEENFVISPLSVSMALSMTMNGAKGETFEAMKSAMMFKDLTMEEVNEGYRTLSKLLTGLDPDVEFLVANSIWFREGLPVNEDFLARVKESFGAGSESMDFRLQESIDRINKWVDENTNGKIETIIDEISDDMVMFLINAIYFKGDWLRKFDVSKTVIADFHLEDGSTKFVDMMSQNDRFASYFSDEVHMVELPYGDSLFTMSLLLPADPSINIERFVREKMNAANLSKWRSGLSDGSQKMVVELPRFEIEYELNMNELLKEMGMEIAFDDWDADFTGIADISPQNISIGEVKHKAVIRVDEEGSEAAAVTNVGMVATSMPPVFRADRPFVFILHERVSGANLFMGLVVDP